MAVEFIGTDQGFASERARRELGWRPRVDFATGMGRVQAWLREDGQLDRKDSAFSLFQDATWAVWVFIVGFIVTFFYNLSLILPVHRERRKKKAGD